MIYIPVTSILRIFFEINDFEEIQNSGFKMADSRWRLVQC